MPSTPPHGPSTPPATTRGLMNLSPAEQLRAGRMGRRIVQLMVGLWLFGSSTAILLRSGLGLAPWDVLHQGISHHVPLSIGTVAIVTGAVVLLLWIPLREWPGLGTVLNIVVIGLAMDATLAMLPPTPDASPAGWAMLLAGIAINALGGALYIGAQLGPGPRDGLMTALARITGRGVGPIRTGIEVTVLAIGWLLGGTVGVATVVFAIGIGPLVQRWLPACTVELDR